MPPPVRIEARAWDDPRFAVMGRVLGVDRDLALIKFARVWAYQTEEHAPTVSAMLFDALTGLEGSATAAVGAGLADLEPDGAIRPRGADSLTWLADYRERVRDGRAVGGKARAARARRGERGEFLPGFEPTPANGQLEPRADQQTQQTSPASPAESSLSLSLSLSPSLTTHKDPPASPSARRMSVSAAAEKLADILRQHLLAQKPDHAVARASHWATRRKSWAREFSAMLHTDLRKPERAVQLMRWVFGDQGGSSARFVVESATALRSKWDRIENAMRHRRSNGEHVSGGAAADEVIQPRRRNL